MNKRTQKFFTKLINKSILILKNRGFSTKDISDKWHTFGDLYYHRMMLTQALSIALEDIAWKSKLHADGTMFDGSFIIGFSSDEHGDYTYHYDLKYWDLFVVDELKNAPEYDGHKPEDIGRLVSMAKDKFWVKDIRPEDCEIGILSSIGDYPLGAITYGSITTNFEMTDELKKTIYGEKNDEV